MDEPPIAGCRGRKVRAGTLGNLPQLSAGDNLPQLAGSPHVSARAPIIVRVRIHTPPWKERFLLGMAAMSSMISENAARQSWGGNSTASGGQMRGAAAGVSLGEISRASPSGFNRKSRMECLLELEDRGFLSCERRKNASGQSVLLYTVARDF